MSEHITGFHAKASPELRERVAEALWQTYWNGRSTPYTASLKATRQFNGLADAATIAVLDFLIEQSTLPDYMNTDQEQWLLGWKEALIGVK